MLNYIKNKCPWVLVRKSDWNELLNAIRTISNGDGTYGQQAFEYKKVARNTLNKLNSKRT